MHTHTTSAAGRSTLRVLLAGAAGSALLAGLSGVASAQVAEDGTVVVVTAQKREQKLQDVPIVVTTLSARLLQDAGVRDIKDMQILTPGLTVTSTQNESLTTARIRGVGTVGDNPGMESSVGIVIDGVYRPRNGVGFEDLGEMERIEVLKGPQGTVFGKNTSAGVINVITRKPQFSFGADAEATFGNYGAQGLAGSVTGPLSDTVAGRFYIGHRERDGYTDVNTGTGPRSLTADQDQNFTTVRGQLLFVPNDRVDVRVIADFTRRDENCCVAVQTRTGPTGAIVNALAGGNGVASTANPESRLAYANRSTHQLIDDQGISVEANIKLPGFFDSTLTSITGIRDWSSVNGQDIDYTGADILYRKDDGNFDANFKTLSQEVRLAGGSDHLYWMVGAFYASEELDRHDSYIFGSAYEPFVGLLLSSGTSPTRVSTLTGRPFGTNYTAGSGALDVYTQKATSLALFTNNSFKLTDSLELTLGLRYTSDEKEMTAAYTNTGTNGIACGTALAAQALYPALQRGAIIGALCPFWANPAFDGRNVEDSQSNTNLSGTFKAAWHVNDGLMAYASYARGYKDGGYNLDRAQTTALSGSSIVVTPDSDLYFPAETVDSYELGFKASLLSNKLMVNVAAFDQTFNDFQLNTFLGTAFVVESIPELTSQGIDADLYWSTPIPGLAIQGGLTYAETMYGDFTAADLINPSHFPGLSLLPGSQMSFAPKLSATTAFTWTGTIGGLRTTANLSAKYSDAYNTGSDLIPYKMQDAYTLVNGRIGIGPQDRSWTLELWGQNLTDVTYYQVVINAPMQGSGFQTSVQSAGSHPGTFYNQAADTNTYDAFLGTPKTYGLTLRVKY